MPTQHFCLDIILADYTNVSGNIYEVFWVKKVEKFDNFRANLVEFLVEKGHFCL